MSLGSECLFEAKETLFICLLPHVTHIISVNYFHFYLHHTFYHSYQQGKGTEHLFHLGALQWSHS